MTERRILYICEGLQDEPLFLSRMMEMAYPPIRYKVYPYKTTIHTLASKLARDYDDFDSGESDIQLILRDMETDPSLESLLSESFSDIIMGFDSEPHHDNPDFETVSRMLRYYTESSDMGKLYINYPMMQSYKHFSCLPDDGYSERCASPHGYKELVGMESRFTDLQKFTYDTFIMIAVQNLKKAWKILHGVYRLPDIDEYLNIPWCDLYEKEREFYWSTDTSHVLNTLVFALVDYNPSAFFSMVNRHPERFGV